ncbi:MAG: hypothetical protein AAB473_01220 [Patescibacteria group bacterium]
MSNEKIPDKEEQNGSLPKKQDGGTLGRDVFGVLSDEDIQPYDLDESDGSQIEPGMTVQTNIPAIPGAISSYSSPLGQGSDNASLAGVSALELENRAKEGHAMTHERLVETEALSLKHLVSRTRATLQKEVDARPALTNVVELIDGLEIQLAGLIEELEDNAADCDGVHIDASRYSLMPIDTLVAAIAEDLARVSEFVGRDSKNGYLGSTYTASAKTYITERLRYESLREYLLVSAKQQEGNLGQEGVSSHRQHPSEVPTTDIVDEFRRAQILDDARNIVGVDALATRLRIIVAFFDRSAELLAQEKNAAIALRKRTKLTLNRDLLLREIDRRLADSIQTLGISESASDQGIRSAYEKRMTELEKRHSSINTEEYAHLVAELEHARDMLLGRSAQMQSEARAVLGIDETASESEILSMYTQRVNAVNRGKTHLSSMDVELIVGELRRCVDSLISPARQGLLRDIATLRISEAASMEEILSAYDHRIAALESGGKHATSRGITEKRTELVLARDRMLLYRKGQQQREMEALAAKNPHVLFGIPEDATRMQIEQAFAAHMQVLDFDRAEDRREIADLQRARERLLVRAEAREKEETFRRAEENREAQEEADRAHYAWLTRPMVFPEVQKQVPEQRREVSEGLLTKLARIPGRWIRGLVLSGTAFAAIGESAEHQKEIEQAAESARAAETLRSDQGGVDVDQDRNTEDSVATRILPVEVPNTDHVVADRETLWKVLSDEIRNRDLRVTNEKIVTLKHYADLENPGVDWEKLQVGQVIHLKQVEGMLDQMEGKPTPLPESGFRAVLTDESIAEDNIPASTFGKEVQRINHVIDRGMTPEFAEAKAYSDIPRNGHEKHAMVKGEWIYKIIHLMLGESGFNWSVPRMTRLKNMTLQENGLSEAQAAKLPPGAIVSFNSVLQEIQAMKAAKEKTKKK